MTKKPAAQKVNRYRIEAVDRALMLLDTIASIPGANASQLAAALGANRSLVFRLLNTLADRGFVARDANNLYRLGPRLLYLGRQAENGTALVDASRDVMDMLARATQENVYLIVRDGLEMLCLSARISPHPVRLSADVGTKGGLHTGGAAKVLLAYAPQEVIEQVLDLHLGEFVPKSLRTRYQVLEVLKAIRRDGYYEAIGEINPETYTITVGVRDGQGHVVAVLSSAGPTNRLDTRKQGTVLQRVRDAAQQISQRLGG